MALKHGSGLVGVLLASLSLAGPTATCSAQHLSRDLKVWQTLKSLAEWAGPLFDPGGGDRKIESRTFRKESKSRQTGLHLSGENNGALQELYPPPDAQRKLFRCLSWEISVPRNEIIG